MRAKKPAAAGHGGSWDDSGKLRAICPMVAESSCPRGLMLDRQKSPIDFAGAELAGGFLAGRACVKCEYDVDLAKCCDDGCMDPAVSQKRLGGDA